MRTPSNIGRKSRPREVPLSVERALTEDIEGPGVDAWVASLVT